MANETTTYTNGDLPSINVRDMRPDDEGALFDLYREVVADGGAQPLGGRATLKTFRIGWTDNRRVFVAVHDDQIAGSYFIRPNFPAFAAHIAQSGYIVARHARRKGIGRMLLEDSLHRAANLGYSAMMFNLVFERNPSRHLYESVGLQAIGRIPQARPGEDALIYWLFELEGEGTSAGGGPA